MAHDEAEGWAWWARLSDTIQNVGLLGQLAPATGGAVAGAWDGAPWWARVPIFVAVTAGAFLVAYGVKQYRDSHLTTITGQTFTGRTVRLDGRRYVNCVFDSVAFVYGGGRFALVKPTIRGSHRFETPSGSIATAVDILKRINVLEPSFAASWERKGADYFKAD